MKLSLRKICLARLTCLLKNKAAQLIFERPNIKLDLKSNFGIAYAYLTIEILLVESYFLKFVSI
jgi:hypothetical protein